MQTPPHYVLTGGPCAGKTTTIEILRMRGYDVSPEPGRVYFETQFAEGRTIEELLSDMPTLERNILRKHVELERANRKENTLFFDRGIPDCLAYYRVYDVPEDAELQAALAEAQYRKVFLLELIETFSNDNVRVETPEQARRIHEAIRAAYTERGHEIIDVPVMPVPERVDFIVANL
jgi:predicted ATPase